MSKIAVLVPDSQSEAAARRIIAEQQLDIDYIKVIHSNDAVHEARRAVENGARVIIARGYQALLIKNYTKIPVVDIRFHAQEIGLLLQKAKSMVKKERPHIGLIIFKNMLCDMTHMEELFGVKLSIRYMERIEEASALLDDFPRGEPDLIIGGEIVCQLAADRGYPSIIYASTDESVSEALYTASRMLYAAETEAISLAQFDTVLDISFNAIVKVNTDSQIIAANKRTETLLQRDTEQIIGTSFQELFPEIGAEILDDVLAGRRDNYITTVSIRKSPFLLSITSIRYEEKISGAIVSFTRTGTADRKESSLTRTLLDGFTPATTFADITTACANMKQVLEQAKIYALSDRPVLIYCDEGTEYLQIAEAIHNNSRRKSLPFLSVDVSGMDAREQELLLFGSADGTAPEGAFHQANHGTVFLEHIEELALPVQNRLYYSLLSRAPHHFSPQGTDHLEVRIIGTATQELFYKVKKGLFSEKLFFSLQGLALELPSLSKRSEDLNHYFRKYFKRYCSAYNKYLTLTEDAAKEIARFPWPGNRIQLEAFCERLVLDADRSHINEAALKKLYDSLYPQIAAVGNKESIVVYKSPEAAHLSSLLEKHHGNRALVAQELGISTTTLWRRIKKYGIEANFGGISAPSANEPTP